MLRERPQLYAKAKKSSEHFHHNTALSSLGDWSLHYKFQTFHSTRSSHIVMGLLLTASIVSALPKSMS